MGQKPHKAINRSGFKVGIKPDPPVTKKEARLIPPAGTAPTTIEIEEIGHGVNGKTVGVNPLVGPTIDEWEQVGPGQWAKKPKPAPVTFDPITRPEHYCKGDIEPWEFIEAQNLGFHEGSAVSYIARARHKGDEMGDLRKAINFLSRKVKLLEQRQT